MASEEHVVTFDLDEDPETWNTDPDFEPDMRDLSQESEAEDSEEPYSEPICNPSLHKKLQRRSHIQSRFVIHLSTKNCRDS